MRKREVSVRQRNETPPAAPLLWERGLGVRSIQLRDARRQPLFCPRQFWQSIQQVRSRVAIAFRQGIGACQQRPERRLALLRRLAGLGKEHARRQSQPQRFWSLTEGHPWQRG